MKYIHSVYITGLGTRCIGDEVQPGDKEAFAKTKGDWSKYVKEEKKPRAKKATKKTEDE